MRAATCLPKDFFSGFPSRMFLMYMRGVLAGCIPQLSLFCRQSSKPARTAASRHAFTPPKAFRVWRDPPEFAVGDLSGVAYQHYQRFFGRKIKKGENFFGRGLDKHALAHISGLLAC
jgi:hypothetical protein